MENEEIKNEHPDYREELIQIIRSAISPMALKEKILDYHDNDIAAAMEELSPEDRGKLYRILESSKLANILEYMEDVSLYLGELSVKKKIAVLSDMETDRAAEYLKSLPKGERTTLIEFLDDDARRDIAILTSFDEDEIGSIMTTDFISVTIGITVKDAMRELIEQAAENDNIETIYVVGEDHLYYGALNLKDLIRARESMKLDDIVSTAYPYVYAHELIDDCVNKIKDYAEDSIPVLDHDNKLLGIITSQDMMEVVGDTMIEDYARFASLSDMEDLNESAGQGMRKRLPWLAFLLVLSTLVSSVIGLFDGVVSMLSILAAFQSLVLDMAGNSGTQSLAVTIRVLGAEDLDAQQKRSLVFREGKVGIMNGFIMGAFSIVFTTLYLLLFRGKAPMFALNVSFCIGFSMLLSMTISSLMGTLIPLAFKRFHVDPAIASGPLITTINDLVAAVTFYGMAFLLLIRVLGYAG